MARSILSEIQKYASNPALQYDLAKRPMKEIEALYKNVEAYLDTVNKAIHTIRGAKDLRKMKSTPKPFHVYKNGKILTKETDYALAWLKIFFDYFKNPTNKVEGSYQGVFPEGTFKYKGKSYEFSLITERQINEIVDLFSLPLLEIKSRIKENNFPGNIDHKKLYELRLQLARDSINYDVIDKRPTAT